jgi:hypothetical protein
MNKPTEKVRRLETDICIHHNKESVEDSQTDNNEDICQCNEINCGDTNTVSYLQEENCRLKTELLELRRKVSENMDILKEYQSSLTHILNIGSSDLMQNPGFNFVPIEDVKLIQVFCVGPVGEHNMLLCDSMDDFPVPIRFKTYGSFPHAIKLNRKNVPIYEVESRRSTSFQFKLVNKRTGRTVDEREICSDGLLPFRIQISFADTNKQVTPADFGRLSSTTITKPPIQQISEKQITNGNISFDVIRWDCTSNDSYPRSRSFVLSISPSRSGFADAPDLSVTTHPFFIKSKITK